MVYVMEGNVISVLLCGYVYMVWWVYVECVVAANVTSVGVWGVEEVF